MAQCPGQPAEQKLHGAHKRYRTGRVWLMVHMLRHPQENICWDFGRGTICFSRAILLLPDCPDAFKAVNDGFKAKSDPKKAIKTFGEGICRSWTLLFKKKQALDALELRPAPTAALPAGYQNANWNKLSEALQTKVKEWMKELYYNPELDLVVKLHQHRDPTWRPATLNRKVNRHKLVLDVLAIVFGETSPDQSPTAQPPVATQAVSARKQITNPQAANPRQEDITTTLQPARISSPTLIATVPTDSRTTSTDSSSPDLLVGTVIDSSDDDDSDDNNDGPGNDQPLPPPKTLLSSKPSSVDHERRFQEDVAQSAGRRGGRNAPSTSGGLEIASTSELITPARKTSCPPSASTATATQPGLSTETLKSCGTGIKTALDALPPASPQGNKRAQAQLPSSSSRTTKPASNRTSAKRARHASTCNPQPYPTPSSATSPTVTTQTAVSSQSGQPDAKRSKRQLAQSQLVELLQMDKRLEAAPAVVRTKVQKLMGQVLHSKLTDAISNQLYKPIDVMVRQCIQCKYTTAQWPYLVKLLTKTAEALDNAQTAQLQIAREQAAIQRIVSIDRVLSKVPHARWALVRTGLTMLTKAIYTGDEPADAWEQALKAVDYGQKMNTDQIWTLVCAGLPSGR
eukprot:TRINITY_DN11116_c0_g2_i2.p1 TRINITY_DN11116_c0_g2~~TRINITY_DN11116_c0_g2_i2.p1  ORF type:complete len:650 (+),score=119.67 TRINITY_DN11116_c0_g2_i2:67-1950(+)